MSNWLFDLGNSRLKAAPLHDDGSLGEVVALAHGASSFLEDLQAALPAHGDSACLSSVASPGLTTAIVEILASRYQRVSLARSVGQLAGVRIAYADPSRLGVDRFLTLLAARARALARASSLGWARKARSYRATASGPRLRRSRKPP